MTPQQTKKWFADNSIRYAREYRATLTLVDDEHRLADSINVITGNKLFPIRFGGFITPLLGKGTYFVGVT